MGQVLHDSDFRNRTFAVPSENYSEHSEQLKMDSHVEIVFSSDQNGYLTVSPMTIEAEIISVKLE